MQEQELVVTEGEQPVFQARCFCAAQTATSILLLSAAHLSWYVVGHLIPLKQGFYNFFLVISEND